MRAAAGCCGYTGFALDWQLLGEFRADRRKGGGAYCNEFDNLPSVDHVRSDPPAEFRITSWQLNRAKGSHSWPAFLAFCYRIVQAAIATGDLPASEAPDPVGRAAGPAPGGTSSL